MKLPAILASDLHLTANPADEYRWGLFPWLAKELVAENAKSLLLLGDLTDAKDYHSAELVNRVVRSILELKKHVERIIILRGNHDFLKDGSMFFEFLDSIPGVEVITKPTEDIDGELCYFLPYSKNPARDWQGLDFSHYQYLFMHQTVKGALASNGQRMAGEPLVELNAGKVYSGDIHVPQIIGKVEYVGSPYHVHFGDSFTPRCIAVDRKHQAFDLHFPCLSRTTVDVDGLEGLQQLGINAGDQIKVRVHLPESSAHEWRSIRGEVAAYVANCKAILSGLELIVERTRKRVVAGKTLARLDPEEALYRFVEADDLGGELLDVGLEILESV